MSASRPRPAAASPRNRRGVGLRFGLHLVAVAALLAGRSTAAAQCPGDCNADGEVTINEVIVGVNIALGSAALSACPAFDRDADGAVAINELIAAVNAALSGCPATPTAEATETPTVPPPSPTDTATSAPSATDTASPTETVTAIATATNTLAATDTATVEPTGTETAVSTATATHTSASATDTVPPTETATPAPSNTVGVTATFTATATPTMGAALCGNGFLEPGETCQQCAMDCIVGACTASATMASFQIQFEGPLGAQPTTGTFLLGYKSNHVGIPGSATATSVRQRVTYPAPLPNVASVNDLDYALRLVVGRNAGLANGLLATVKFDACNGAPAVTAADFGCTVEACAGAGGAIDDCLCTVTAP